MFSLKPILPIAVSVSLIFSLTAIASVPMTQDAVKNVKRVDATTSSDRERLSATAGLLANYEIESKKLITIIEAANRVNKSIQQQIEQLLSLSEMIIESAQFRLPQCDEYLEKSLLLKTKLDTISHADLEKDYHLDGALPTAPVECYHTKDLFVHPATVAVITRDNPKLSPESKQSIKAEVMEVLGHTELVRQLVVY